MKQILNKFLRRPYRTLHEKNAKIQNRIRFFRRSSPSCNQLDDRNVVVFVVDCLRADHLSRAGYPRETTPFLNVTGSFWNAISAASWTYSSVPSILTGLYPHNHGATYETDLRDMTMALPSHSLATDVFTLPERLAASGYRTYLTTAIPTAEMPLRGRVHSRTVDQHAPASKLVDDLLQWWTETDDSPRFGYVHFGDLHEPLKQPNREPFGKIPNVPGISRWRFTTSTEPREQFETYRRERIRLYDTLLRGVDRQIARFHRTLTERGEDNNTIIVVTGDHGEEFWEWVELERERFHDPRGVFGVGHGHSLVPEVVDVPLVTIGARNAEPRSHVSTVDIVPTLLHELGHPYDQSSHFDGVPIGKIPEDRPVLAEEVAYGYDQQAVVCGDFHLIHSPHEEETLLLDRSTGELLPDAEIIEKFVGVTEFDRQKGAEISVNQKVKQQLSDLGYR